jgi:hypothetical protein
VNGSAAWFEAIYLTVIYRWHLRIGKRAPRNSLRTSNSALTGVDTMNNNKLQDFVTTTATRGRITFGDVRRLQRDHLPGGITSCEEAALLIDLDRLVSRADRAWLDWLVSAIRDFAARCDQTTEAGASQREPLQALLAARRSSRVVRRINAEISRPVDHPAEPAQPTPQTIPFPVKRESARPALKAYTPPRAVLPVGHWSSMTRLPMAA